MTDNEILRLVDRFERCLLAASEFHHRHHLVVAVTYLYGADLESAIDKMRASLLRFTAHHGGTRYHETITHFWMIQVERHLNRAVCLKESVDCVIRALPDKDSIYRYYSRMLLQSSQAKEHWVPPDLCAL